MKYFNRIYFVLFLFYCKKDKNKLSHKNDLERNVIKHIASGSKLTKANTKNNNNTKEKALFVIVHGLSPNTSCTVSKSDFKNLEKKLKNIYKEKVNFLYVIFNQSVKIKLEEQSEIIKKFIDKYFIKNQHLKNSKIIFLGHCTGALAALEFYQKNKKDYKNIVGIVSSGTPWQGASAVINYNKTLTDFFKISLGKPLFKYYNKNSPPVMQIVPGTDYLKKIKELINNCDIPIWAVGGHTKYINNVLQTQISKFVIKEEASEKDIFGSKYHDGAVNLESQIGSNYDKIISIPIKEHTFHTDFGREKYSTILKKVIKLLNTSKEDTKKILSFNDEKTITQTNEYKCVVTKFLEKYVFNNYINIPDKKIIKMCINNK